MKSLKVVLIDQRSASLSLIAKSIKEAFLSRDRKHILNRKSWKALQPKISRMFHLKQLKLPEALGTQSQVGKPLSGSKSLIKTATLMRKHNAASIHHPS